MLFLLFQLGNDRFALPASRIVEVVPLLELKTWAQAPKGVAGTINFRGGPVPVVDLCELAAGSPARRRLGTRIIVVRHCDPEGKERLVGLIAEQVTETLRKDPKEFREQGVGSATSPGPIWMDSQRALQWLDERRLLAEPVSLVNRLLSSQPCGGELEHQPGPKGPAKISAVVFRIQAEWLAFPTTALLEVVELRKIHSLPHRRNSLVLGLTNVRGELLICVALDVLLGIHSLEFSSETRSACRRLLVMGCGTGRFAFSVDEVHGLHRVHAHELKQPPATLTKSPPALTQGVFPWATGAAGLLDAERLVAVLNQGLS